MTSSDVVSTATQTQLVKHVEKEIYSVQGCIAAHNECNTSTSLERLACSSTHISSSTLYILSTEMHSMTENQTQSNFFLNKTATIDKINKNITALIIAKQCPSPNRVEETLCK